MPRKTATRQPLYQVSAAARIPAPLRAALETLGWRPDELAALETAEAASWRAAVLEALELARQVHGQQAPLWLARPEERLGGVLPASLLRDPANGPTLVKQALLNELRGTLP